MEIGQVVYHGANGVTTLIPGMSSDELSEHLAPEFQGFRKVMEDVMNTKYQWDIAQIRCFLDLRLIPADIGSLDKDDIRVALRGFSFPNYPLGNFINQIERMIHLPGFRGNPQRDYPVRQVLGTNFPGRFEDYTASLINEWVTKNDNRIITLSNEVEILGLASLIA